jgi:VanZ family protein
VAKTHVSTAPNRRFHPIFLAAWVLQLIAVISTSLAPGRMIPLVVGAHDKWAHFLSYLLLGFLPFAGARHRKVGILLALAAIPMGGGLELLQHFVPGRTPELADAAANSMGVLVGLVVAGLYRTLRDR